MAPLRVRTFPLASRRVSTESAARGVDRAPFGWRSVALVTIGSLLVAALLCGIQVLQQQSRPRWIEAHGRQTAKAIAASGHGLMIVGMDDQIRTYPVLGRVWPVVRSRAEPRLIAGYRDGALVVDKTNTLWGWRGRDTLEQLGPVPPGLSAIATDDGARVIAVVAGDVLAGDSRTLGEPVCEGRKASKVAAGRSLSYVLTTAGEIVSTQGGCPLVEPRLANVIDITVWGDRLVAVDRSGQGWVLSGDQWRALDRPARYRADTFPQPMDMVEARGTDLSLWARDVAGTVYVFMTDEPW
jgi:hypothetical protein